MIIFVPGDPVGKQRPRMVNGHVYTPMKTKEYEDKIAWEFKRKYPRQIPFKKGVPLEITIRIWVAVLKNASHKKREAMLNGIVLPTKTPDADNIAKSCMDGLQGVCYENDDSVVTLTVSKRYASTSGVLINVREIVGENSP